MLAALILQPTNADAWTNLQKCYEALGLAPVPIITKDSNHLLDDKNPIVHRQLSEACAALYRNFMAARQPASAQALREMALKRYRVSEAIFTAPP